MNLTYFGHSCFSVTLPEDTGDVSLLFDPFLTSNPKAHAADFDAYSPDAHFVLISHGHFDHIEDAVGILLRTGATAVASYEICEWLHKHGVPMSQLHHMNIGGTARFEFGTVQMVNAVHSSTLPDGSSGGGAAGFVVRTLKGAFYYAGDTGLTLDMQLILRNGPLKFAVFPVGDTLTMGPEDALEAARLVKCGEIVGVHFDTWPNITIDQNEAKALFKFAGKNLHLLGAGETIAF